MCLFLMPWALKHIISAAFSWSEQTWAHRIQREGTSVCHSRLSVGGVSQNLWLSFIALPPIPYVCFPLNFSLYFHYKPENPNSVFSN